MLDMIVVMDNTELTLIGMICSVRLLNRFQNDQINLGSMIERITKRFKECQIYCD